MISAGTPSKYVYYYITTWNLHTRRARANSESKVPFNSTLGQNRDYDGSEEAETTSDDNQEHIIDDYGSLDDDDDPFIDGEIIHANLMYKQRTMFKYKEVVNGAGVTGQQSAVRDRMILQQGKLYNGTSQCAKANCVLSRPSAKNFESPWTWVYRS